MHTEITVPMSSHNGKKCIDGKRIIIVLGSLELGGAERQALLFARYMVREHDAHVEIWGFNSPGRTAELCEEYGIPWRIVPQPLSGGYIQQLKGLMKFAWTLRRVQPEVILPYTMVPNIACSLIWRWTGAKLCVWNQRDEGRERMGRNIEQLAIYQTPMFISNSKHSADFLVQTLGVKADRIQIIGNGIEISKPELNRIVWRKRLGVDENHFLVCMVANLSPFKDHITLLKAWRIIIDKLDEKDMQPVLLLAGRSDSAYDSLKALAVDMELNDNIQFLGKVNDITGLLNAVDLGVLSSRFEGCPNGVLECMASGLAVAGTDIPGIREAVGVDGFRFLAPPGDFQALADRIIELATNLELRSKLGVANRQRIEVVFNPRRMSEKTFELISRGLSE